MSDNFIWTKHVQERSLQRGIGSNEVWSTLRSPDNSERQSDGSFRFYKNFNGKLVCIAAKQEGGKWIILTTFTKESTSGAYRKYVDHKGYQRPLFERIVFGAVVRFGQLIAGLFQQH
jgi:hypothetical protein